MGRREREAAIAALSAVERQDRLERVTWHTSQWLDALRVQHARIEDRFEEHAPHVGTEMWLYASALGGLLRCVQLAGELGADVSGCLASFDASVPSAKSVRDVLQHLEDYELGVGRLQLPTSDGTVPRFQVGWSQSSGGVTAVLLRGVDPLRDLELPFPATHLAVERLVKQVEYAVWDLTAGP